MPQIGAAPASQTGVTRSELDQALALKANASSVMSVSDIQQALLADSTPMPEAVTATKGAAGKASREDHRHERLTSSTNHTVLSGNTVAVTFTRAFVKKPGIVCTELEGDTAQSAQPALFKVNSWTTNANGEYVGCVIRAWRSVVIPQNLATLLLSAAVNIFGGSVVGTQLSCVAVQRSD